MCSELTLLIPTLPLHYSLEWQYQLKSYLQHDITVILSVPPGSTTLLRQSLFLSSSLFPKLIVFESSQRGQVFQRSEASALVSTKYCLLMDDDILFSLSDLLEFLSFYKEFLPVDSVLAPRLTTTNLGRLQSVPVKGSFSNFLRRFVLFFIHGCYSFDLDALYGTILPSGSALPYPSSYSFLRPPEAEWLPGGCLLMLTSKLALNFYYPFSGKAYSEDLYHSHMLINRGLSLFYHPSLFAYTSPLPSLSLRSLPLSLKSWFLSSKCRIHFCWFTKRSIFHSILFSIYDLLRIISRSLFFP